MLYCSKCGISVTGDPEHCPLCQCALSGEPDPEGGLFVPLPSIKKERDLVFRIVTMALIAVVILGAAADYLLELPFRWLLILGGGAACVWVFSIIGWRKRAQLGKNLLAQTFLVSCAGILWDVSTGWRGWSLDYVVPAACIAGTLALFVLLLVLRSESSDYLVYLVVAAVMGFAPLVFLLTGIVRNRILSTLCVALCALVVVWLLLFYRQRTVSEIKKKFHY